MDALDVLDDITDQLIEELEANDFTIATRTDGRALAFSLCRDMAVSTSHTDTRIVRCMVRSLASRWLLRFFGLGKQPPYEVQNQP